MKFRITILLILALFVVSCSLQKRSFRNGYYVSWNHKKNHSTLSTGTVVTNKKHTQSGSQAKQETAASSDLTTIVSDAGHNTSRVITKSKLNIFRNDNECGDIITLRKGDPIKAKVIEVGVNEIKYKRCDNLNGPLIIISKSSVYSIKYLSGHEDHFFETPAAQGEKPASTPSNAKRETHPLAIASLVCTILISTVILWPLVSLLGLILGVVAANEISAKPNEYKGYSTAKTCAIISGIALALFIFLIFLLLLAI